MGCVCNELAGKDVGLSPVCIGHLWVFKSLQKQEVEALTKAALRKEYKKGQAIFMQGDSANEMFLLKAGRVKLSKISKEGDEITLDIRKAGDFIGEHALSEDFDYPLTAVCMEDSLACGFTKEAFEKLILENPNIGLQVIRNMAKHIEWLTSRAETMTSSNLEERLYNVLVNIAKEHGIRSKKSFVIQFPLTHEELSFLVGVHRVSITRAFKGLKNAGRIEQKGRTLVLPRVSA